MYAGVSIHLQSNSVDCEISVAAIAVAVLAAAVTTASVRLEYAAPPAVWPAIAELRVTEMNEK